MEIMMIHCFKILPEPHPNFLVGFLPPEADVPVV